MTPRTIRVSDDLWADVQAEAEDRNLSTSEYVRAVLRTHVRRMAEPTSGKRPLQTDDEFETKSEEPEERLAEVERRLDALETTMDTLIDINGQRRDHIADASVGSGESGGSRAGGTSGDERDEEEPIPMPGDTYSDANGATE